MKMIAPTKFTILLLAALGLALTAAAADTGPLPPASTKTGLTYAADIKPIFETSCVKCHSGDKPKARLKLDTLENALKGSKDGKVITPGNSANSFMVKCVAHVTSDHDSWMPPAHNKANIGPLTPEQIGLIRAWIDQGAK
jgi:mono/diheme cytochrome c family protein